MNVRSKVWLEKDGRLVFGTGKAGILRAVAETGSLNGAARQLNMSYRHVWSGIRAAEQRLGFPLLTRRKGGKRGGGAVLTEYAGDLLRQFEELEKDVKSFANRRFKDLFQGTRERPEKRRM